MYDYNTKDICALDLVIFAFAFLMLYANFEFCLYLIVASAALAVFLGLTSACIIFTTNVVKKPERKEETGYKSSIQSKAGRYVSLSTSPTEGERLPKKHNAVLIAEGIIIIMASLLFLAVYIYGMVWMGQSRYESTRYVVETQEIPIVAMGENTSIYGGRYYIRSVDNYVVLQQIENGGYQKGVYPCYATTLFETDTAPYTKTITTYAERVLTVTSKWFVRVGETMGENVGQKRVEDVQYELYVPKGMAQQIPSMENQFEGMS